jgi:hypothetical protein
LKGKGATAQIHFVDVIKNDFCLEPLGMFLKTLHEIRSLNTMNVRGPIVYISGGHELAALSDAGDQEGLKVGSGGVDGSSVSRRAGAQDQNFGVFIGWGHGQ